MCKFKVLVSIYTFIHVIKIFIGVFSSVPKKEGMRRAPHIPGVGNRRVTISDADALLFSGG